jgi:hypothetical protein
VSTPEKPLQGVERATIYCEWRSFYWGAECTLLGLTYATRHKTHGSARQAADEILDQVRERTGKASASIRRIYAKQYEIVVPNEAKAPTKDPA